MPRCHRTGGAASPLRRTRHRAAARRCPGPNEPPAPSGAPHAARAAFAGSRARYAGTALRQGASARRALRIARVEGERLSV
jgi:hypothetical protein